MRTIRDAFDRPHWTPPGAVQSARIAEGEDVVVRMAFDADEPNVRRFLADLTRLQDAAIRMAEARLMALPIETRRRLGAVAPLAFHSPVLSEDGGRMVLMRLRRPARFGPPARPDAKCGLPGAWARAQVRVRPSIALSVAAAGLDLRLEALERANTSPIALKEAV